MRSLLIAVAALSAASASAAPLTLTIETLASGGPEHVTTLGSFFLEASGGMRTVTLPEGGFNLNFDLDLDDNVRLHANPGQTNNQPPVWSDVVPTTVRVNGQSFAMSFRADVNLAFPPFPQISWAAPSGSAVLRLNGWLIFLTPQVTQFANSRQLHVQAFQDQVAPVPEPSSLAMLGAAGAAGVGMMLRRRGRHQG